MYREAVSSLMLVLLVVSMLAVVYRIQPASADVDWWPMFHHDLTHIGYSSSTAPRTNSTIWTSNIGGYDSSPIVTGGLLYMMSSNGNFYALNASTGSLVWSYFIAGTMAESCPAFADGIVYVSMWYGWNVYALNALTGAYIWSYHAGDRFKSSPAVAYGLVYDGCLDYNVYALNAYTGALVWRYNTGFPVDTSPAVANGIVYVGSENGNVHALNAYTGAKIWSYATGNYGVTSSPTVVNSVVYVGSWDDSVYALNANTGALIWRYSTGSAISSSPAVANGIVYVGSGDHKVYALNANTGAFIWSYATGGSVDSSPALADGVVYVGSWDDSVYALDAYNGALIWRYTTNNFIADSSPAIADGKVYIGSGDGNVYAFGPLPLAVSISPTSVNLRIGQSQLFSSSVSGGTSPYTYQWYLDGAPVSGATNPTWAFTQTSVSSHTVSLVVNDSATPHANVQSNNASVTANWLDGWEYRKSHVINSALGAGTGYQERIVVWRTDGTDGGENVYLGTSCRTDFGDIRFTGSDGVSELDYWLETYDSSKAVFWVKIADDLGLTSQTIYMYYGNDDMTTTSNGLGTFLLFRDLTQEFYAAMGSSSGTYSNGQDPGDYFTYASSIGSVSVSPCMWFRDYGGKQYELTSDHLYFNGWIDGGNYGNVGVDIRIRDAAAPTGWQGSMAYVPNAFLDAKHILATDYSCAGSAHVDFYSTYSTGDDTPEGNVNEEYLLSSSSRVVAECVCSGSLAHITTYTGYGSPYTIYHQYYAVAKYTNPEPAQGSWGTEEALYPQYSGLGITGTVAYTVEQFQSIWSDSEGLSGGIFGSNLTGTFTNDTWTSFAGGGYEWFFVTKYLNSSVGSVIQYCFWVNSTTGYWNSTGYNYATLTDGGSHPCSVSIVNSITGTSYNNFTTAQKNVGDTFTVNVTICNGNLTAWQALIIWNISQIQLINCTFPSDDIFWNMGEIPFVNIASDYVACGNIVGVGYSEFDGNGTLCQLEFKILLAPTYGQNLASDITYEGFEDASDTFLLRGLQTLYGIGFDTGSYKYSYIGVHDVAVVNVTSKTVVGQGYDFDITVGVADLRNYQETFNLTLYATIFIVQQNVTLQIASQNITLESGNSANITFVVNTAGYPYGNYTISAYAWPVLDEINLSNNNFTLPFHVHVGVPGDVSGTTPGVYDGITNMKDIAYLVSLFQTKPTKPNWNPNADVNNDGVVDMKDIAIAVYYFNQHE